MEVVLEYNVERREMREGDEDVSNVSEVACM